MIALGFAYLAAALVGGPLARRLGLGAQLGGVHDLEALFGQGAAEQAGERGPSATGTIFIGASCGRPIAVRPWYGAVGPAMSGP